MMTWGRWGLQPYHRVVRNALDIPLISNRSAARSLGKAMRRKATSSTLLLTRRSETRNGPIFVLSTSGRSKYATENGPMAIFPSSNRRVILTRSSEMLSTRSLKMKFSDGDVIARAFQLHANKTLRHPVRPSDFAADIHCRRLPVTVCHDKKHDGHSGGETKRLLCQSIAHLWTYLTLQPINASTPGKTL
jgi:hypothetical protein